MQEYYRFHKKCPLNVCSWGVRRQESRSAQSRQGAHQSAPHNGVGIPDDIEGRGRDGPDLSGNAAYVGAILPDQPEGPDGTAQGVLGPSGDRF
jgi:hypothetical protein